MAADLYIHTIPMTPVKGETMVEWDNKNKKAITKTYEGIIDENILAVFFANTIGSKWYECYDTADEKYSQEQHNEAFALVSATPKIWVGEVSWLKAALLEDEKQYIPPTIMKIDEIIDENLPVIDDELIEKIAKTFDEENTTGYELNSKDEIIDFLHKHKGLRCFTVSW